MAKKAKETRKKDEPFNVFDMSWVDERAKEVEEEFATYDPANDPVFRFRWKGDYTVRFLPCLPGEWMMKSGFHFGVVASGDDNDSNVMIPCVSVNGEECPICAALSRGVANGNIDPSGPLIKGDKQGKGKGKAKATFVGFARILLVKFKGDTSEQKTLPKFNELPVAKIGQFPRMLVTEFNKLLQNPEYGKDAFFDPDEGLSWSFNAGGGQFYWTTPLPSRKPYPLPEEFRTNEAVIGFYDMNKLKITQTADDVMKILEKHQNNIPELLFNEILAIDVGEVKRPEPPNSRLARLRAEHDGDDEGEEEEDD